MINTVDDLFELVKKNFNMKDFFILEGTNYIHIYKSNDILDLEKAADNKDYDKIRKFKPGYITLCFRDFTDMKYYSVDEFVGHNTLSLGYIGEKSTGYSLICDEVDISNEIVDFIKEHLF